MFRVRTRGQANDLLRVPRNQLLHRSHVILVNLKVLAVQINGDKLSGISGDQQWLDFAMENLIAKSSDLIEISFFRVI
jgi:hypothetical protein